ncbi:nucleocapsid protein [Mammarenavirus praomyidis]|uniref:Nucleoprotein n=3 Tax=Mobala mammarenavirus (isolate Rat/Central African Republic/Acar 3080/1983) TaxID=3052325 RepID=NCAP_MOBVC|nr:nucleocapsid protein [Mammarenavirus praomyidis]Q2A068.1 RecName: Full=Nucleoprotein; AltName: Full=Nucleocapsid protein; AltName: Full=Protein N [Mammarenavirus praomyidis]AAQ75070.1 nucleocapsid protein [Mammarenavirus praomyidis]
MSNSKEIKSFLWTQSLRRELSGFCTNTRVQVIKDAQSLLHGLDFSEVSNIQRLMRKEKRDDSDLKRLRDLNQTVNNLVELKSSQQKNTLRVGALTSDDLLVLAADLDRLKAKVNRSERPLTGGVYMGNLTQQQLDQRKILLQLVGMGGSRVPPRGGDGIVRVWDVRNPDLLNNQFGTMPSLTLACLCKQGQEDLSDVVKALTDLGLVYTAKYPNLSDLDKLTHTHPVLGLIDGNKSAINISGYNFSLNAAVKAGASLLDGGNMLETIKVTPKNIDTILKCVLKVKRSVGMFVSDTPGERNPYENILYKICLSGDGWPYIACRTSISGRAWDNTEVDLGTNKDPINKGPPTSNKTAGAAGFNAGLTYSQMMELKDSMLQIDPTAKTWVDIEGRADDPVEIAIYQPSNGHYIHFYREPTDIKQFRQDAKYSHGIDVQDLFTTQPGLTSAVLENLPKNMVLTCQGVEDIRKLLDSQGRKDIKLIDVSMQKADARKFEHQIWDEYKHLCSMHTGIVVEKKKRGGKEEITPHCALLDCLMFEATTRNSLDIVIPRPVLSKDLVFRSATPKVIL